MVASSIRHGAGSDPGRRAVGRVTRPLQQCRVAILLAATGIVAGTGSELWMSSRKNDDLGSGAVRGRLGR